jgi:hypothetical protein
MTQIWHEIREYLENDTIETCIHFRQNIYESVNKCIIKHLNDKLDHMLTNIYTVSYFDYDEDNRAKLLDYYYNIDQDEHILFSSKRPTCIKFKIQSVTYTWYVKQLKSDNRKYSLFIGGDDIIKKPKIIFKIVCSHLLLEDLGFEKSLIQTNKVKKYYGLTKEETDEIPNLVMQSLKTMIALLIKYNIY